MAEKRDPNALYCDDKSLTQQHFAEECDINEILRRSAVSGVLPVNDRQPMYGDFTSVPKSLTEAFGLIKQANDLFMALPWQARERFGNNPERMIAFLNDPQNREEAVKLGLVKAIDVGTPAGTPTASAEGKTPPEGAKGAAQ